MFKREEYELLHSLVFREDYSGYKPAVKEIPNGDGKVDAEKRYAHIALKYLPNFGNAVERMALCQALFMAHGLAEAIYQEWGGPPAFRPDIRYGALRVLKYPPGAVSHSHQDFDLFTTMLYRDALKKFKAEVTEIPANVRALDPYCHTGRLGELIGLGKATTHEVLKSSLPQHSMVYFAIPDHDAVLPKGDEYDRIAPMLESCRAPTVRDWLNERMARSRTEFKAY